jgi:hypothetical protein
MCEKIYWFFHGFCNWKFKQITKVHKFGYTKYKLLIILLYVWLHNENHIYESGDFYFFFPLISGKWKPSKILFFNSLNFYFNFWRYIAIKKKGCLWVCPMGSKPINWVSEIFFGELWFESDNTFNISPWLLSIIYFFFFFCGVEFSLLSKSFGKGK